MKKRIHIDGKAYSYKMALILIMMAMALFTGCSETTTTRGSSLEYLMEHLPNISAFDLLSCTYTIDRSKKFSLLPSDSDVKHVINGEAVLSEEARKRLLVTFKWKPIYVDEIPEILLPIASSGELLFSEDVSQSFKNNPYFQRGFIVMYEENGLIKMSFVAIDKHHLWDSDSLKLIRCSCGTCLDCRIKSDIERKK